MDRLTFLNISVKINWLHYARNSHKADNTLLATLSMQLLICKVCHVHCSGVHVIYKLPTSLANGYGRTYELVKPLKYVRPQWNRFNTEH